MALPTTTSARIKANALIFQLNTGTIASPTWKDYSYDCISLSMKSEDAANDQTTFYDASLGGATDIYFEGEIVQSLESASFWQYLWSNPGTEVQFRYAPSNDTAITSTNPGFTGSLRTPRKLAAGIGGAASVDGTFQSETMRFDVVGSVTQATTGTWTRA